MEALTRTALDWGVATFTLRGERESGDRCVVVPFEQGVMVAVIDGLGHGAEAASAAEAAGRIITAHCRESVIAVVRRCHEQLRSSRGVVMSLASFSALDDTMTWLGIGNVEGMLIRAGRDAAPPREFLLLRGGVIGGQLPPLHATVIPVARGDTLVFFTDGVAPPPRQEIILGRSPQAVAEGVLTRHKKGTDDAVVLVAQWVGSPS